MAAKKAMWNGQSHLHLKDRQDKEAKRRAQAGDSYNYVLGYVYLWMEGPWE